MHKQYNVPSASRTQAGAISLGKARSLTRASFGGVRAEMIADRTYSLGG
ncbi:MAG: hypothetical protein ACSLE1_21465 [Sphingobium sp.]